MCVASQEEENEGTILLVIDIHQTGGDEIPQIIYLLKIIRSQDHSDLNPSGMTSLTACEIRSSIASKASVTKY